VQDVLVTHTVLACALRDDRIVAHISKLACNRPQCKLTCTVARTGSPVREPCSGQQHDPRPLRQLLRRAAGPAQVPQPLLLGLVKLDPVRAGHRHGRDPSRRGVSTAPPASLATHPYWLRTRRSATMTPMAAPPASTKTSLQRRLSADARAHWPQLAAVTVRFPRRLRLRPRASSATATPCR
jgi:hypothetical protein